MSFRIFLCKGEKVKILQSFYHTYVVQNCLDKRTFEVKKELVISYYPNRKKNQAKKSKPKKEVKPQQPKQTTFNF